MDSVAGSYEIIFGRARTFSLHHLQSIALLHARWRAYVVQLLRFSFFALPMFGLRAARISDDCP
jgi:hypothetical protein